MLSRSVVIRSSSVFHFLLAPPLATKRLVAFGSLVLTATALGPANCQENRAHAAIDFPKLIEHATELLSAGKVSDARALWQQIVRMNPYDGRSFYMLGQSELAAGDTSAAIAALGRYIEVGGNRPDQGTIFGPDTPPGAAYQIAQLHALRNEPEAALRALDSALQMRYRNRSQIADDTAFRGLRANRVFRRLAAIPGANLSRGAGWRFDIEFLLEELQRLEPAQVAKDTLALRAAAETLIRRIQSMTDAQVVVGLQSLLRLSKSGHTSVLTEGVVPWQGTIPLQFDTFGDSTVVIASDSIHAALLGERVTAIDGHPLREIESQLDSLVHGDNRFGMLKNRIRTLRYPRILNALGLASRGDGLTLSLRGPRGTRSVTVRAQSDPAGYSRITGHPSWPTVFSNTPGDPLFLRDRRTPYWFTYVAPDRLMYFGFNGVVDDPPGSWSVFTRRLLGFIESTAVDKLVIDLRWNNGGNTVLLPPLIEGLIRSKLNQPGHLFVLTSKYTFSAGMNAATFLERDTYAILVGEPTPSQPNFIGESNIFALPYSRVPVSISDIYWQSSFPFDRRKWIAPTIYAPITLEDLKKKNDPALAAVLAYRTN